MISKVALTKLATDVLRERHGGARLDASGESGDKVRDCMEQRSLISHQSAAIPLCAERQAKEPLPVGPACANSALRRGSRGSVIGHLWGPQAHLAFPVPS